MSAQDNDSERQRKNKQPFFDNYIQSMKTDKPTTPGMVAESVHLARLDCALRIHELIEQYTVNRRVLVVLERISLS